MDIENDVQGFKAFRVENSKYKIEKSRTYILYVESDNVDHYKNFLN